MVDEKKVIETLKIVRVIDAPNDQVVHDKRVVNACPKAQRHTLDRLAAITMKCNSARVSTSEDGWLDGLDVQVKEGLEKLFLGVGTHTVTIWFLAHPDMPTAIKNQPPDGHL